jgi:hypothetical protein
LRVLLEVGQLLGDVLDPHQDQRVRVRPAEAEAHGVTDDLQQGSGRGYRFDLGRAQRHRRCRYVEDCLLGRLIALVVDVRVLLIGQLRGGLRLGGVSRSQRRVGVAEGTGLGGRGRLLGVDRRPRF